MSAGKPSDERPGETWRGGIDILESETSTTTTSGDTMSVRYRPEPLPNARAASELDFDSLIAPAEEWARDVLRRAGIKPDGKVNGVADTPENYAQRFIDYGRAIRASVKRGDTAGAVAEALVLGGFIRESQLKFKWETHVEKYERTLEKAREKGRLGGLAKGKIETDDGNTNLTGIIRSIAFKRHESGELLQSDELWPELCDALDKLGLHPEQDDNECRFTGGQIAFSTFKTMLSQIRE